MIKAVIDDSSIIPSTPKLNEDSWNEVIGLNLRYSAESCNYIFIISTNFSPS